MHDGFQVYPVHDKFRVAVLYALDEQVQGGPLTELFQGWQVAWVRSGKFRDSEAYFAIYIERFTAGNQHLEIARRL